ncbi:MAG: hypothetical protein HIU88_10235 [Acidobacteria bacterium]|nr:hypothetical protein [Acidobacteriota bacterium]
MALVSALGAYKAGLYNAAKAVYDPTTTYVCSGDPSQDILAELVSLGTVEIGQVPATLGSNRGREETLTADVHFRVFTGGGDDQQPTADARVGVLLTMLEQQVHYTDTSLGGAVRECFLTSARLDSGVDDLGNNTRGRVAVINATFTARARISNG